MAVCVLALNSVINIYEVSFLDYDVNCFLINGAKLTISDSLFLNSKVAKGENYYIKAIYGTLYCEYCINVSIINCTFNGNYGAKYGGGITFYQMDLKSNENNKFLISQCKFLNNSVFENGGAILIYNAKTIIYDTIFQLNVAKNGGGVFFESDGNIIQIFNCDFRNNEAETDGGAIKWTFVEPILKNNAFSENKAYYGKDIASFPIRMRISFQSQNNSILLENLTVNSIPNFPNISSGSKLSFNLSVEMLDCYGQIVSSVNSNRYFQKKI